MTHHHIPVVEADPICATVRQSDFKGISAFPQEAIDGLWVDAEGSWPRKDGEVRVEVGRGAGVPHADDEGALYPHRTGGRLDVGLGGNLGPLAGRPLQFRLGLRRPFQRLVALSCKQLKSTLAEFTSIVRPILGLPDWIKGTVTDGVLQLCGPIGNPWGFIVVIRTGALYHGVLLPIQEDPRAAVKYLNFLEDPFPKVESRLMRWDDDDEQWMVAPSSSFLDWPSGGPVGPPGPGEG